MKRQIYVVCMYIHIKYVRKYISDRHVGPALCYALAWRHVLGLSFIGPNVAAAFGPFASCLRLQLSAKPFWAT